MFAENVFDSLIETAGLGKKKRGDTLARLDQLEYSL